MLITKITPMLITFNEEANLGRVLAQLEWAQRILIIDSGSTDDTLKIAAEHPKVEVVYRLFDSLAAQCNFGLTQVRSEWVLSMDSDYELSNQLVEELHRLEETPHVAGYVASFVYRIYGRPLRASLYPPRVVLYRVAEGQYRNEGHGHRLKIEGDVLALRSAIFHDDRKPLSRWLRSQLCYAEKEARYLLTAPKKALGRADRIRKIGWPAPLAVFLYVLLGKRALLDGWAGWYYAFQRLLAEVLVALELADQRLRKSANLQDNGYAKQRLTQKQKP